MNKIQEILHEATSAPDFRQRFTKWSLIALSAVSAVLLLLNYLHYLKMKENRYDKIIAAAGKKHGLDPLIIKSIIKRESKFNPNAKGGAGEIGLMQIIPDKAFEDWKTTHKKGDFSAKDLYDPATNIEVGSWYFARQVRSWKNTKDPYAFALTAYNAGPGNLSEWIKKSPNTENINEIIRFPMTKDYVNSILTYYGEYQQKADELVKSQP